jgi:hypothetical protein
VVAGDRQAAMSDFTPDGMQAMMAAGIRPPQPATKAEIVNERQDGDRYVFDIKYSNDQASATIRSTWAQMGDEWKIVHAEGA